uniref:CX domain-containing protein n=1 Tax=Caenorhabditis tropicalis TaxID=1561998 RepID=A0A1I7TCW3_9PELO
MLSSPFSLAAASVFSLFGLGLVGLAVFTDNWVEIQVNRREIINSFKREPELSLRLQNAFGHNIIYFSRNYGLFNLCFPDTVPQDIGSFNKMGSPCIWSNDFMVQESKKEHFSTNELYRHYAAKAVIVAYFVVYIRITCTIEYNEVSRSEYCFRRVELYGWTTRMLEQIEKCIMSTGILLILAGLFMSVAMLLWHYVAYSERYTLDVEPYYKSWEPVLKLTSRHNYGWSYIVSWIGIGCIVVGSAFFFFAYAAVKREEEDALTAKHGAYMMPNYYDKGAGAIVPYNYNTYAGYGNYPYYNQYNTAGYYGYMTYGR